MHDPSERTRKALGKNQKDIKIHQKQQASVRADLEELTQKLSEKSMVNSVEDYENDDFEQIEKELSDVLARKQEFQASANQRKRQTILYEKVRQKGVQGQYP